MDRTQRQAGIEAALLGRRSAIYAAAAAVAGVLGLGARSAGAATGDVARLGQRNEASATTAVVGTAAGQTTLRARAHGSGGVAVDAISPQGSAVHGYSQAGNGLAGESVLGVGVSGHSIEPGSYAVSGDSTEGTGVQGGSHYGTGVQGNSQFGVAVSAGNISETEPAIRGWAQNGQTGIMGRSTRFDEFDEVPSPQHVGVFGLADRQGDTAVLARSLHGRAIDGQGRVRFATSGMAMVAAGTAQVTVAPVFPIVASAKVIATAQGDPGNAATVRFVDVDAGADTFTIRMTRPVGVATPVAWFLLD